MLTTVPGVLDAEGLARARHLFGQAQWIDGAVTAGPQSGLAKRNRQIVEGSEVARALAALVLDALGRSPLFIAAALPHRIYPPLFNAYAGGETFGTHIDNAIRHVPGTEVRLRSDLSATLFLADPGDYDGGELVIEARSAPTHVKLAAGDMALYPASSLHRIEPVTRGERLAAFFWIESMVRDDAARRTLLELDESVQAIAADRGMGDPTVLKLTGIYHNLLRRWAQT